MTWLKNNLIILFFLNNKYSILFILLLFFKNQFIFSQTQKQWEKFGDKSFQEKDFYGASLYYKDAMHLDSTQLKIVYKYAESLRLYNEYELSEKYYKFVFDRDKKNEFREALFWYSSMQKYNAKYQEARKNFTRFLKLYKDQNSFYYKKAKQEVGSCEFAQSLMQDTLPLQVVNLGPTINTTNADFGPYRYNDSTLVISSLRTENIKEVKKKEEDIPYAVKLYTAVKKDTLWQIKNEFENMINLLPYHNGNGSFSEDRNRFYFSRCDKDYKCNIYESKIKEGKWSMPSIVNGGVNAEGSSSTQPAIAMVQDKPVLFFVSDRPGGFGKLDVWYSVLEGESFSAPVNAGPSINSIDDELSPFYNPVDKHLYFSSAWHYGLGGYDIFKSKGKPGSFQSPVNLGYPINTSVNDFYYQYSDSLSEGFLTSNRKGSITAKGETCCNDIWFFKTSKEPIKDSVPVDNTITMQQYLPVRLYFHNDEPNPRSVDTVTHLDYMTTYVAYKNLKNKYKEEYQKNFPEEQAQKGMMEIEQFFTQHADSGAKNLEAFTEQLLKALQSGQKLEVTVKGFASPLAKTDYNVNLTLRRISSMENYMKIYKDSALLPYFEGTAPNGGHVHIIKIPFGEYKALKHVNDNYKHVAQSVYSPSAALERKIEIVSVSISREDSLKAKVKFLKEIYNFGNTTAGDTLTHTFKFKNTGRIPVAINNITDTCHCFQYDYLKTPIAPGDFGLLKIIYATSGQNGKQAHHFNVDFSHGIVKELTITAEIHEQ